jgi:hypothetical protein
MMRVGEGDNKNCKILLHSSKTMKVLERVLSLLKAGSINLACVTYSYFHISYCTSMCTRGGIQSHPSALLRPQNNFLISKK